MTRLLAELILCLVPASDAPATPQQGLSRQIAESITRTVPKGTPAGEWVGQSAFPRNKSVPVFDDKKEKTIGTWAVTCGEVLAEDGVWVEVHHLSYPGPYRGWVRKRDLVKASDAPAFFTGELARDKKNLWLYQVRAEAWSAAGEYDKAVRDLNEAIRISPEDAALYVTRGMVLTLKGEYDDALTAYTESARLNPKSPIAFYNRGRAHYLKGNHDKAMADFEEAIRVDPKDAPAWGGRALLHMMNRDYDKALKDFAVAIQLEPKHGPVYECRSFVYEALADYGKMRDDLAEAVRLNPRLLSAVGRYGWLLATCPEAKYRDGKKAVEFAHRAFKLAGKDASWHHYMGLAAAYAEAGDFEKAVEYEKKALEYDAYAKDPTADYRLNLYKQKRPYHQEPQMPPSEQ